MKILVTGGAGYLGSVLVPKLLARGHCVRVLDIGYFGVNSLPSAYSRMEFIHDDIRKVVTKQSAIDNLMDGCDCVIHLAAISNDPSAELDPGLTFDVNLRASEALAEKARNIRVPFLFSSSCSVYGDAPGEIDETGDVRPLTIYAETKVRAEQTLNQLADRSWKPLILRNGTLFGYSPRMRFDLVVNIFCLHSTLHNRIAVFGDGRQWRPFLHVTDCARAFVHFAERQEAEYTCYNLAHENLRVVDLALMFGEMNPSLTVTHIDSSNEDRRDYSVSSARLRKSGFETKTDVRTGAEALVDAITTGAIRDPESIYYRNAKWLKELTTLRDDDHVHITAVMRTLTRIVGA